MSTTEVSLRGWFALIVAGANFLVVFDSTGLSAAFPSIELAFPDVPRSTLAWLSSGFSIPLASLLLLAGKLADRYGRRRIYLGGVALFGLGGIAATASVSIWMLIAARVVQGSGGAMMVATAVALALPEFPVSQRGRAVAVFGSVGATLALISPLVSAVAVGISWRAVFVTGLPICLAVLIVGPRVLSEHPPVQEPEPLDVIGVIVGTGAVALLALGLLQSPLWGRTDLRTVSAIAVSAGLFAIFIRRGRTHPNPIMDLTLFSDRRYATATISQMGTQLAIFAFFFSIPLFVVNIWGWSQLRAGAMIAISLGLVYSSLAFGRYADRHGYRRLLISGGLVISLGMVWWITMLGSRPSFLLLLPGLVMLGLGQGMVGSIVTSAAMVTVPDHALARANAVHQTTRRMAHAVGVVAVVAILGDRDSESVMRFRWVWGLILAGNLFASIVATGYRDPPKLTKG